MMVWISQAEEDDIPEAERKERTEFCYHWQCFYDESNLLYSNSTSVKVRAAVLLWSIRVITQSNQISDSSLPFNFKSCEIYE